MHVRAYSTGTVRITRSWQRGEGPRALRLVRALTDPQFTEPLPIWCWLIEHPEGLILIDTGIASDANAPVWFPPHLRLVQRASPFQIDIAAEEIGPQLVADGIDPRAGRWVVLTHLHQDHDGGLGHFPNAEFVVARAEWAAARGLRGKLAGYLNHRWPRDFAPTLVDFAAPDPIFAGRHALTRAGDVYLVPTPGHSAGHLSVIVALGEDALCFTGDAAYTQDLLLAIALDGVAVDAARARESHAHLRRFAESTPTVLLPSHEWAARERLYHREWAQV
jgi:glyoxylase-like metal-dependent hydrolase (beta-lactamase superfamily II)